MIGTQSIATFPIATLGESIVSLPTAAGLQSTLLMRKLEYTLLNRDMDYTFLQRLIQYSLDSERD